MDRAVHEVVAREAAGESRLDDRGVSNPSCNVFDLFLFPQHIGLRYLNAHCRSESEHLAFVLYPHDVVEFREGEPYVWWKRGACSRQPLHGGVRHRQEEFILGILELFANTVEKRGATLAWGWIRNPATTIARTPRETSWGSLAHCDFNSGLAERTDNGEG
jgi:hypothetical protein